MKMYLRDILSEQDEVGEDPVSMTNATKATRLSQKSADDQIDAYILKFENESIGTNTDKVVSESLQKMSLLPMLNEQEEEEEGGEGDAPADAEEDFESPGAAADDAEVSDAEGSDTVTEEEPLSIVKKPAINIDVFSKKVARLAINYNAQLDIPTVIVNRAINFLKQNYDDQHAKSLIETLNSDHDFNIGIGQDGTGQRPAALGAFGEPEGLPADGGGIPADAGGT